MKCSAAAPPARLVLPQTYIDLIESATPYSTLDIATPGFDSWTECTHRVDDDMYGQCTGCKPYKAAEETFPVFPALLNAVHGKAVKVRLLTNDYGTPTCEGYIAPLDYLALNGIEIRYYTSTTFMHAKYIHVNGNTTAVSSVNFSFTSFNLNREAGLIMSGKAAAPLMDMMTATFDADFIQGTPYVVNQTYPYDEWRTITSKEPYPVVMPTPHPFPNAYKTAAPKVIPGDSTVTVFASPDKAQDSLLADVQSARSSFELFIYQVTDPTLCTLLQKLSASGVNVTLTVSPTIVSHDDLDKAHACYNTLLPKGIAVQLAPSYYSYSHQKFWIVDGVRLGLSTGNWSPTDYPAVVAPDGTFPPYSSSYWQDTNRDFNLLVSGNTAVVDVFRTVLAEDHSRGTPYTPNSLSLG